MNSHLTHGILVIDFGSQTTLLITRRLRELGVYSEVWSCFDPRLTTSPPLSLGYILSGGPASVSGVDSPQLARTLLDLGRPVLGICYGMQLLVEHFGGEVRPGSTREFGRTQVQYVSDCPLLADFTLGGETTVWMSHSDAAISTPSPLKVVAHSSSGAVAAVEVMGSPFYGVQFHPEVSHTELGTALLRTFTFQICGARGDWRMANIVTEKQQHIRSTVAENAKVICGLSGGVDSTVVAALIASVLHHDLVCVLVDTGLMRQGEVEQVASLFREKFDVELRVVDASLAFLSALAGVSDPEQKRKIIGKVFIDVFEAEARSIPGVQYLAQGTLYPDVIESTSVRGPSSVIKSHHNVGGLPERLPFKLLEPVRDLFKDEVRELGRVLGVPEEIVGRHPFPGPGLAIRILGDITAERIDLVRRADHIFIQTLRETGQYDQVWQAFVVLLPVKTVGVMGDARTYESVVAIRAVTSRDGMTADRADLPWEVLGLASNRIINQVRGINRVVYDLTSKPPATIEWE